MDSDVEVVIGCPARLHDGSLRRHVDRLRRTNEQVREGKRRVSHTEAHTHTHSRANNRYRARDEDNTGRIGSLFLGFLRRLLSAEGFLALARNDPIPRGLLLSLCLLGSLAMHTMSSRADKSGAFPAVRYGAADRVGGFASRPSFCSERLEAL